MTGTPTTPEGIRRAQRASWDTVAAGWHKWWPSMEAGSEQLTQRMLALGGLTEGARVLDVATGIGEPALSAAQVVGPAGGVVATDVSEAMLDIARQRVADAGVTNVWLVACDERLAGIEGPVDAVLSRWGVMFFGDVPGFLARARELLRPGGRLALALWASPAQVPMATAFAAAARVLEIPSPPADAPGPFRFADVDAFAAMLADAGFTEVTHDTATVRLQFDSAETFTRFIGDIAAPIREWIAQQPARADEVWAAVTDAVRPFEGAGGLVMDNVAPVVAAVRP